MIYRDVCFRKHSEESRPTRRPRLVDTFIINQDVPKPILTLLQLVVGEIPLFIWSLLTDSCVLLTSILFEYPRASVNFYYFICFLFLSYGLQINLCNLL